MYKILKWNTLIKNNQPLPLILIAIDSNYLTNLNKQNKNNIQYLCKISNTTIPQYDNQLHECNLLSDGNIILNTRWYGSIIGYNGTIQFIEQQIENFQNTTKNKYINKNSNLFIIFIFITIILFIINKTIYYFKYKNLTV